MCTGESSARKGGDFILQNPEADLGIPASGKAVNGKVDDGVFVMWITRIIYRIKGRHAIDEVNLIVRGTWKP